MYRNKRTGTIGIIITIFLLILVVILSNMNTQKMSGVENALATLVMPIQNGLTYLKNKMEGNDTFFTNISRLQEENEELKQKNSDLEQSLRELEMIKSENEILKEYVNLKDKYKNYETVPAYIIHKDISNYSNVIVINVGSSDGIEANMTVIADKGLVGYVLSTTETTAKVQTIVDTATSVSAVLNTSREAIILNGMQGNYTTLKATFLPTDASILQNDNVETSGLGGIYPKGIHIGTVKEMVETKNTTDRYAYIETAVDFKKLETVLVIKDNVTEI